jgi:hypothetical protein
VPDQVSTLIAALRKGIGENQMMAYIVEMTARLVELRRTLKPTGSLYLHCDPTASHYLKIILDSIFGPERFGSEIIWKRSSAHSDTKQGRQIHGHIHDTILFYMKGAKWTWNPVYTPYDASYVDQFYRHVEPGSGRRYRVDNLTAAKPGGDTSYEWHGVKPYKGRFWAYAKSGMEKFESEGRLIYSKSGMPQYKRYLTRCRASHSRTYGRTCLPSVPALMSASATRHRSRSPSSSGSLTRALIRATLFSTHSAAAAPLL